MQVRDPMPSHYFNTNILLAVILVGCSSSTTPKGTGGNSTSSNGGTTSAAGGVTSANGGTTNSSTGKSTNAGGNTSTNAGGQNTTGHSAATNAGGSTQSSGGAVASGGTTGTTSGATNTAGTGAIIDQPTGGKSSTGSTNAAGGSGNTGGKSSSAVGGITGTSAGAGGINTSINGGATAIGGAAVTGGATATGGSTFSYMLPPPDQCHDRDYIQGDSYLKTGCIAGDATSECGGKCETASVCESPTAKPTADRLYMCQRNLLFSPEFEQAAIDDGMDGFHYAVVGHDPDKNGIDGNAHPCCQCYQLVYAYPSPNNDRQVQVNPDNPNPPASAVPLPAPLIVQAFNTAATPTTFDVYMPAGGMGAQNGCFQLPNSGGDAAQRKYMYSDYPLDGQPGSGGVKPASLYDAECKTTEKHWVTEASISSSACVARTKAACDKITSSIPGLSELGRTGCLKANTVDSLYHLNWSVYAMKIECPEHLTRVTGCKLAPQGLKTAKKDVKTAAQASKDSDFWSKTGSGSGLYETTTMEDCCRPTCASYSQISGFGLVTDPKYRSFYNCDIKGVPYTQPQ